MQDKEQILATLREEYETWQALLAGLSEEQITARQLPGHWSIKDVMAHLKAWQERSIERLAAGLQGREPDFRGWPDDLRPEAEEDVHKVNAWIYTRHRDLSWNEVYRAWRDGYLRLTELARALSEEDLFARGKYRWLGEGMLADVLVASYEHHHEEHLKPLQAWLANRAE